MEKPLRLRHPATGAKDRAVRVRRPRIGLRALLPALVFIVMAALTLSTGAQGQIEVQVQVQAQVNEKQTDVCDDGRRCTANDRLIDGACTGEAYSCHDDLDCTNDLCDGAGGCRHFIASGYCLIDEQCHQEDATLKGNACRVCDPNHSNVAWHAPSGRPCLGGVCRDGSCMVNLSVHRRGSGSGVVLGRRMLCDSDCRVELPSGTRVRLTAEASRGSQFEGWSGACTGAAECVIVMSAASTVAANFTRKAPSAPPVQLIVEKTGNGVVTSFPAGVDCGEHCWHTFAHGTMVTLYATPLKGMEFRGWNGGCHGRSRECSVELRAAQMVSADFGKPRRRRVIPGQPASSVDPRADPRPDPIADSQDDRTSPTIADGAEEQVGPPRPRP